MLLSNINKGLTSSQKKKNKLENYMYEILSNTLNIKLMTGHLSNKAPNYFHLFEFILVNRKHRIREAE